MARKTKPKTTTDFITEFHRTAARYAVPALNVANSPFQARTLENDTTYHANWLIDQAITAAETALAAERPDLITWRPWEDTQHNRPAKQRLVDAIRNAASEERFS